MSTAALVEPPPVLGGVPLSWTNLGLDQTVGSLVAVTSTLESGSAIAEDLDRTFKADRELEPMSSFRR